MNEFKEAGKRLRKEIFKAQGKDMLADIIERNKSFTQFARKYSPLKKEIPKGEFLRRLYIAIVSEVGELSHEIPFKWWGRGVDEINEERIAEELVDQLHFIFIMFDEIGYSAGDIYDAYIEKNNENWKRFKEKIGWGKANP